ncbi:MAG: ParA family protein [Methylobacteriaceae bacterium]|nr:ParA family protein [Methylobacteriaceae bacterium]
MTERPDSRAGAIVAFVSQKGGVGKSTLSRGLAREAAHNGLKVKIADLDIQQGTSIFWQQRRLASGIEPRVSVENYRTAAQALQEANQYDLLIIDGPARASEATREIATAASLVVQPTQPSLDDLEPGVKVFHELVKAGISKQKLAFAITKVLTPGEVKGARAYLTEAGYSVLDGFIPAKTSYREAQDHGRSITETRFEGLNQSADELIQSLIDRISNG